MRYAPLADAWLDDGRFQALHPATRCAFYELAMLASRGDNGPVVSRVTARRHMSPHTEKALVAGGMITLDDEHVTLNERHQCVFRSAKRLASQSAKSSSTVSEELGTSQTTVNEESSNCQQTLSNDVSKMAGNRVPNKNRNRIGIEENTLFESTGSDEPLSPAVAVETPPPSDKRAKGRKSKAASDRVTTRMPLLDLESDEAWEVAFGWAREHGINPHHPAFPDFFADRMAKRETSGAWIVNWKQSGWLKNSRSSDPKTWAEYLTLHPAETSAEAAPAVDRQLSLEQFAGAAIEPAEDAREPTIASDWEAVMAAATERRQSLPQPSLGPQFTTKQAS